MVSDKLRHQLCAVIPALLCVTTSSPAMQFTAVTTEANILHKHVHSMEVLEFDPEYSLMSGGAVAEDFDGDGWIDLYVLKGGDSPNLLYMNQGDGTFIDEALSRGAGITGVHMAACAADFDSDGDVDIFVSGMFAPHVLLRNTGSGQFTADYDSVPLPARGVSSPSFGDLNNDGMLELALGAWIDLYGDDETDRMQIYWNEGNGQLSPLYTFQNEFDFIPFFMDLNGDRWQDLLAVADFGHTRWYANDGTGLLFESGRSDIDNGMGAAVGDIDSDGDLDVFMTSIGRVGAGDLDPDGNRLLLNDGLGQFTDITDSAGVRYGDWAWGTQMADFDNDGDLDIYMVNGHPLNNFAYKDTPARLFENMGDNVFEEVAANSGDAADMGQGRAVIVFDYDNDGDQDIFITNNSTPVPAEGEMITHPFTYEPAAPVLLRNDTVTENHYLKVMLNGLAPPHNAHGIGSRVYVQTDGLEQMRELHASSGFNGHGPHRIAHFGLGTTAQVDRVRAVWTNGDVTERHNVAADQVVTLNSPRSIVPDRQVAPGEVVTAEFPEEHIPDGATANWRINGVDYGKQAVVQFNDPGIQKLEVNISTGDGATQVIWSETIHVTVSGPGFDPRSVAQIWNEQNLDAIRIDFPDPTTHARNLFATSMAMWDAWAAYDAVAMGVLHNDEADAADVSAARKEAVSYAAYRVLKDRYSESVNASITTIALDNQMEALGYDKSITSTVGDTPAALGNRVAEAVLAFTNGDGADDVSAFMGTAYTTLNDPLKVVGSGTEMAFPNHWQPLEFDQAFTQNQQPADLVQEFLGPHWGAVRPFALASLANNQLLHLDPGPPPLLGTDSDAAFKSGSAAVIEFSSFLDPGDGHMIDISPGSMGNNSLGLNNGNGHPVNPYTGLPYEPNLVPHADFGRVLAEFWADGPDSETPPGHWNTLANSLHEHPAFQRLYMGNEPELDRLEWDVKLYLALNGALHDAAIAAWGCKRVYDYVRPISSIRYMGGLGQSTNPGGPAYHPLGLPLIEHLIEVVTAESAAPGQRHAHLIDHVGEMALYAWSAGENGTPGGVDWMLAVDWLPYQRTTFVTPAFPGYVSGHSTFSRAAAEVLTRMTGSPYFPGGLGSFTAVANEYLEFEVGPTTDIALQWATYYDASDQAGISRLYGGIHVPADDGPGRVLGSIAGVSAWELAIRYFDGSIRNEEIEPVISLLNPANIKLQWNAIRGAYYKVQGSAGPSGSSYTDLTTWNWSGETRQSLELTLEPNRLYRILRSHKTE